jgi:aryl-alcohol dehydrogenase-like predicted oxidoreductase
MADNKANSLNSYITLGNSGLRVSPFCLGTMTFGEDWGWGSTVNDSETILSTFFEQGGNFIDTANGYTKGHSEKIIGDYFQRNKGLRNRMVIATKFTTNMYAGDPNGGGANNKTIIASCEESLKRLQTDYIDLYWMHAWDKFTPIEETMKALDNLVNSGKVRYIGFSDSPAWKAAQAQTLAHFRGWSPLIALQIEYSLMERTVEDELIPMAMELGLGVTPWGPLRGGALSGKYTRENAGQMKADRGERVTAYLTEKNYDLIDELLKIAKEHNTTAAAIALSWLQNRPGVSSTIIGARTLDQLKSNLAALEVNLTPEQSTALDNLSKPPLSFISRLYSQGPSIFQGGTKVNGEPSMAIPMFTQHEKGRYLNT